MFWWIFQTKQWVLKKTQANRDWVGLRLGPKHCHFPTLEYTFPGHSESFADNEWEDCLVPRSPVFWHQGLVPGSLTFLAAGTGLMKDNSTDWGWGGWFGMFQGHCIQAYLLLCGLVPYRPEWYCPQPRGGGRLAWWISFDMALNVSLKTGCFVKSYTSEGRIPFYQII